ncbi:MAG: cellulase family glycosylhydrolase [Paludibacteraceae bacterium]|nr:cellulase family glycosylhydrolase [Paludibacteraceae bacterium]
MRHLLPFVHTSYIVLFTFVLASCTSPRGEDGRGLLLARLNTLQQQGTMFGHQDDPFYGLGWAYEDGRSDVLETCGDYPAVMGFDIGGIEMGDTKNLDSVPFDLMRQEIIRHHQRGGIVTISWHPRNPVTGGTAWDATDGVVTAILAEGETHDLFMTWLERVRTFLSSLSCGEEGEVIPFIFRPWHENNGAWFWWGNTHCTPDEYKALWNLTQDYIQLPITNHQLPIIWSYSPNLQGGFTDDTFLPRYPGDDRVDLIGLDAYQWGTEEEYLTQAGADLNYLCTYGAQHNKLVALTECGRQSMPDPTWWHRVLLPLIKSVSPQDGLSAKRSVSETVCQRSGLCYALVWRNADVKEHFGPVPNTANGREFMRLYNDPHILFLNDIAPSPFVKQQGGRFMLNGKPYSFIGTNIWYGAILGSTGQGGNRERLIAELDTLAALGISNLRILVGSDGERGVLTKVEPTLQIAPGVYNDTILDGLDFLLAEMNKRNMKAVLYLNNSWEWSGGYGFYLEHAGYGKAPRPEEAGYEAFMRHVAQFADSPEAQSLFFNYVRFIVSRTNRYTHTAYVDDPAIMTWQIGNEPRAFGETQKEGFACWLASTSALIRSIDPNHLISIGSEGIWGCEMDSALYHRISADPNIDYLTVHIWPYNWGWTRDNLQLTIDNSQCQALTYNYLKPHLSISAQLRKPIVIEEFGFPRDNMSTTPATPTTARDEYYRYIFSLVQNQPEIAGCNFWAWGGMAQPAHDQWQVGDDYTGDPAQEPQGLNSVFPSDSSTITLIRHITHSY